jgi:hypothetical protein
MDFNNLIEHSEKARTSLSFIIKVILILSICYAIYMHSWRILFIDLILLLLIFMPDIIRNRFSIHLPKEIEIILLVFVILSFLLGEIQGLIIQIFFGLAISFVGFTIMLILYAQSKLRKNYFLITLFAVSISLAIGLSLELAKFYTKWFLGQPFHIIDYQYAMVSLTLVLIGALIASFAGIMYMKGFRVNLLRIMVESFKRKNPNLFIERTDSPEEVLKLIKEGENKNLEFKSTLRTNLFTGVQDKKIEIAALKTITAFLNSLGGTLLIGVSDKKEITGIEKDHFQNNDKFILHFANLIKEHIGSEYLPFLSFELVLVENKTILKVECEKSNKPVFLKNEGREEFYIRMGAASVQIFGSKLIDYIRHNFRK